MESLNKAWIYCRIDAPEDVNGQLKQQKRELLSYAEQMDLEIAGDSSDLGSGLRMDRHGLQSMLEAAHAGRMNVLLVTKMSRIGRNPLQTTDLIRTLSRCGVKVYSPLEGELKSVPAEEIYSFLAASPPHRNALDYPYLVGYVYQGTEPTGKHTRVFLNPTPSNIASFIVRNATLDNLVLITTPWDTPFLSTSGTYVDQCVDQQFCAKELSHPGSDAARRNRTT